MMEEGVDFFSVHVEIWVGSRVKMEMDCVLTKGKKYGKETKYQMRAKVL